MNKNRQRILVMVVLVLVFLFGVGQFFSYSNLGSRSGQDNANQPSGATRVITGYVPVTNASTPVKIGFCFAQSIAAPFRPDAYRCMAGNEISDPCFQVPGAPGESASYLACGANPAGGDASSTFILISKDPLPSVSTPSSTPANWAWLVELKDGTICMPFTGTLPFSKTGEVANYGCRGTRGDDDMIFDVLDNTSSTGVWLAKVGSLSHATSSFPPLITATSLVPVYAVWQ